jgi:uncharacterized protein YukE
MASGQDPDDDTEALAAELERRFAPVRGSWGGLALAAHAHAQLGNDAAACRLVDEELQRAKVDQLEALLPALWQWMHSHRTVTTGQSTRG